MPVPNPEPAERPFSIRLNPAPDFVVDFSDFHFDIRSITPKIFPVLDGVVAQLVERLNGIQEVAGSNPVGSTILNNYIS